MICEKRVVHCYIMDKDFNVLSLGVNSCYPAFKKCCRQGVKQDKENYTNDCNSIHAEIDALYKLPPNAKPHKAIIKGHDFACEACEKALKAAGIEIIEIQK